VDIAFDHARSGKAASAGEISASRRVVALFCGQ
jgi:hypothetical protein